jgi:hypothetical protein
MSSRPELKVHQSSPLFSAILTLYRLMMKEASLDFLKHFPSKMAIQYECLIVETGILLMEMMRLSLHEQ